MIFNVLNRLKKFAYSLKKKFHVSTANKKPTNTATQHIFFKDIYRK